MTLCTSRSAVIALILCTVAVQPVWGQQYFLYTPQPASSDQKTSTKDGVLVKEVEVRKGDTLYDLSHKYSGRGMYYPQILLFNSIKNPNLIYSGDMLKVPVTQDETVESDSVSKPAGTSRKAKKTAKHKALLKTESISVAHQPRAAVPPVSAQSTELTLSDLKAPGTTRNSKASRKNKTGIQTRKKSPLELLPVTGLSAPLPASHKLQAAQPDRVADITPGQKLFEAAVKAYRTDDCRTALELLDRYLADNSGSPLAADANLYKAECYLKLSVQ